MGSQRISDGLTGFSSVDQGLFVFLLVTLHALESSEKILQCCQCDVNVSNTTSSTKSVYVSKLEFVAVAMNKQSVLTFFQRMWLHYQNPSLLAYSLECFSS